MIRMKTSNLRCNPYLILLVVTSVLLYASLMEDGIFTIDEVEYLYISKAISERFSLDCSPYFKEFTTTDSNITLPMGFFEKDGRIHAKPSFGFPLIASLFYGLFKASGLQLLNVSVTLLTTIAIFFFSKRLWRDKNTAYISSTLYLFCTFSVFYAVSLWYHSLITLSFFISMASVLYFNKRKWIPVFLISSAICIWTAYYMIAPIIVLLPFFILKLKKKGDKLSVTLLFFVILFISLVYNNYVYSEPFTGYLSYAINAGNPEGINSLVDTPHILLSNILRMFYGFIAMFICRWWAPENLSQWVWCQKSILESSPFLITAAPGIVYLYKKGIGSKLKFIILSNLAYILLILYGETNVFGAWELSMRHLLPVIPLMTIISSGFISKFLNYKFLYLVLAVSTVFSYFSPTFFFDSCYYTLMSFSPSLTVFLLSIWIFHRVHGRYRLGIKTERFVIAVLLISLIFLSNFININDVKIGNEVRLCSKLLSEKTGRMEITDPFIFRDNIREGPDEVVNIIVSVYSLPLK